MGADKKLVALKTSVDKALQRAADVVRSTKEEKAWKWASGDAVLKPLRTVVSKVEAHKGTSTFWKQWSTSHDFASYLRANCSIEDVELEVAKATNDKEGSSLTRPGSETSMLCLRL